MISPSLLDFFDFWILEYVALICGKLCSAFFIISVTVESSVIKTTALCHPEMCHYTTITMKYFNLLMMYSATS